MTKYCSRAFRFAAVILAVGMHAPNPAAAQNVNQPVTPQPSPYVVESPPTQAPGIRRPSTWEAQLIETLSQNKRYPSDAVSRGEQGTAIVAFTLDRSGNLLNSQIKQSSGYASLDREAVELLSRINRFPPFPTDFQKDTVTLTVPIKFRIGGKLAQEPPGTAPTVNPGASSAPVPSSISSGQSVATASNPQTSQPSGERVSQGAKADAEAEQVKVQQAAVEAEREKARAKQAEVETEKAKAEAQAQQAKAEADRARTEAAKRAADEETQRQADEAETYKRQIDEQQGQKTQSAATGKTHAGGLDIKGHHLGMSLDDLQREWNECHIQGEVGMFMCRGWAQEYGYGGGDGFVFYYTGGLEPRIWKISYNLSGQSCSSLISEVQKKYGVGEPSQTKTGVTYWKVGKETLGLAPTIMGRRGCHLFILDAEAQLNDTEQTIQKCIWNYDGPNAITDFFGGTSSDSPSRYSKIDQFVCSLAIGIYEL
jgi:TonB family protein